MTIPWTSYPSIRQAPYLTHKSSENQQASHSTSTSQHTRSRHSATYRELEEATKGFCVEAIIGSGGFGEVYKATLTDKTVVAVKKFCHHINDRGELRDFRAKLETLGKIKHPNLVSLLGYCKTANERLLIYEYMENGSLNRWLHGNKQ